MYATDNLLQHIEYLRNKMMVVATEKGFTSDEAILLSQELDKLLNIYTSVKEQNTVEQIDQY
ncbi:aspartyl-phosphate phosphatase Spo0E family protein [Lentibacillus cibarius]|uniref:Aspartyl-phosphate phosphatase Spo0E family protein n=1 Tax=Lentibacillus cibarius TaxID=2583219 RepID=A0A5S3QNL9_9BACI|nr:aspartyl-phosphate phosphatase Spo0E family protein [Lentibacillus cibarius]TMN23425.1 aspartyl-phosphate phosphatase Spo0E family protein [Lentibacillus cibarius]